MKTTLLLASLALATFASLHAAEPAAILKLWPEMPPGDPLDVGPETDITKPTDNLVGGRRIIKLANVAIPEMHVFLPPADKRNGSAVIICPGGGFNILAWDLEGTEVADWLNDIGVAAIVVKYRVPTGNRDPKWLAPVQDAERAMSLTRSRGAEWGIAADQIGILGFSAGGYTAGHVTVNHSKRAYEPVDGADKFPFRPDFAVLVYSAYLNKDKTTDLQPQVQPDKDTPPVFFVHAKDDPIPCEGSIALFLALKSVNVPCELHIYETGGHGYGLRPVDQHPVTLWPARCEDWLRSRGLLAK
jgi:acetyl esterase/lipase